MDRIKFLVFAGAVSLYAAGCSQTATSNVANANNAANRGISGSPASSAPAATPLAEIAMDPKEIYALNCMICHKDTGKGGKVTIEGKSITPDDLTAEKFKKMTDEKLIDYVTNGVEDEGMPAFKGKLTPEQIKSVITHVRTLQK